MRKRSASASRPRSATAGQRARAEDAGVVDQRVELAAARLDQRGPVRRVGDVAGQRDDLRALRELGARRLQRLRAARVDDEPPAALGERAGQGAAEAAGGAGDEGGGHAIRAYARRAPRDHGQLGVGPWPRPDEARAPLRPARP